MTYGVNVLDIFRSFKPNVMANIKLFLVQITPSLPLDVSISNSLQTCQLTLLWSSTWINSFNGVPRY